MYYSLYQTLWLFLIYSFIGWIAETALAAAKKGRFLNRGFLSLPFSPIYGCGWLLFSIFLPELKANPFYLFLGGMILATGLELFTGILLEHLTGQKWWDYSSQRFQFDGYICLPYALIWGASALVCLFFSDKLLLNLVAWIPSLVGETLLIVISILLGIDFLVSITTVLHVRREMRISREMSQRMKQFTAWLDNAVTRAVQKRIRKAYPTLSEPVSQPAQEESNPNCFASGLCLYKLIALFFIAAFLGDIIETIFCRVTAGVWMSRSSVVYGDFSIVWGLGAVLLTVILYKHRNRSDSFVFLLGTVLGGAYEYFCSVFTELVFGTVFWDYSHLPFNLGGRINLLYSFFWGIAAVVWLKYLYPFLSDLIERIPQRIGVILTWIMVVFMSVNIVLSSLAMYRYNQRQTGAVTTDNPVMQFIDEHFPDSRIEKVYPNLILVEDDSPAE